MRILIIGASGVIGRAVADDLARQHEVLRAGRSSGELRVDLQDFASVQRLFAGVGALDAVVTTAGNLHLGPLAQTTPEQFMLGLRSKLMGQVHAVLAGQAQLREGGSFTLTSGIVSASSKAQIRGGSNASTVNSALEGFVQAAATELPRGLRINVISPAMVDASVETYGPFFAGFEPVPLSKVVRAYRRSIEGVQTGQCFAIE
jgi:NAD(P)-dependent dehydrogenase (short-subunit alcohol dehydrogenase family)